MTSLTDNLNEVLSTAPYQLNSQFYKGKKIVLYGAGRLGDMTVKLFEKNGIDISYFVDKNYHLNSELNGCPIYPVEKLSEIDPNNTIVLISAFKVPFLQLRSFIHNYTTADVFTVYDVMYFIDKAYFSNGWHSGIIKDNDHKNITEVFNSLADELSKRTYINFLNWRIGRNEFATIESEIICEDLKYHNEISSPSLAVPGVIVDAGAYDLSFSLKTFSQGYPISKCVAFEPDRESYALCQSILSKNSIKTNNITIEPLAIGQDISDVCFADGHGLASRLVYQDTPLTKVKVTTFSDYFAANHFDGKISVIKIHIEGAELQALLGGKELIDKHRPLLMINCSHNRDGLWAIQQFCLDLKNYSYFMRSHAFYGEGLTFYAVPNIKKDGK